MHYIITYYNFKGIVISYCHSRKNSRPYLKTKMGETICTGFSFRDLFISKIRCHNGWARRFPLFYIFSIIGLVWCIFHINITGHNRRNQNWRSVSVTILNISSVERAIKFLRLYKDFKQELETFSDVPIFSI